MNKSLTNEQAIGLIFELRTKYESDKIAAEALRMAEAALRAQGWHIALKDEYAEALRLERKETYRLRAALGSPLADAKLEKLREATFSTNNPFCPCDSKTFRKVARAVEHAHGIAPHPQGEEHGG